MDLANDETSSKLLEVLNKLDARLETLDKRLQALEHPDPATDRTETVSHHGFRLKYKVEPGGSRKPLELTLEEGDPLEVVRQISSPCLGRHRLPNPTSGPRVFSYPFADLLPYWDCLRFAAEVFDSHGDGDGDGDGIGSLFLHRASTSQLADDIRTLLSCLENARSSTRKESDENHARGVVLFDDLPVLYAPGIMLESGGSIVEVSSCSLAAGGPCVVNTWHFRWNGQAFSRTSRTFEVDRYTGTLPVYGLEYRPVISSRTVGSASQLLSRNKSSLEAFMEIVQTKPGDYPLCFWRRVNPGSVTV